MDDWDDRRNEVLVCVCVTGGRNKGRRSDWAELPNRMTGRRQSFGREAALSGRRNREINRPIGEGESKEKRECETQRKKRETGRGDPRDPPAFSILFDDLTPFS